VKNVAKFRSGNLIIECFRKQQSLNLVALKDINGISISASPHRTLNSSRGIIRHKFLFLIVRLMVFNAPFRHIPAISWRSVIEMMVYLN
jgi:hypothetical protein